jgi:serine protease SohB
VTWRRRVLVLPPPPSVCVPRMRCVAGGYMMAVVASHLVAAPFAFVGSIGVFGGYLNINRALKKVCNFKS